MAFITDKQTLTDLGIFGNQSILAIFDKCKTREGSALLKEMFLYPLPDQRSINTRSGIIKYFAHSRNQFPFQSTEFDIIERYLANTDQRTRLTYAGGNSLLKKLITRFTRDGEQEMISQGIITLTGTLQTLKQFASAKEHDQEGPYAIEKQNILQLLAHPAFAPVLKAGKGRMSTRQLATFDGIFRFNHRETVRALLEKIYLLDVYITVANISNSRNFCFPEALPPDERKINIEGVYHLLVKNAVGANLYMDPDNNLIFFTGANMAGKSTFMKGVSIALFLAHMGFPVPATRMQFCVMDGMFTTINLPDNLEIGASHFYAEVLRVKKIAQELSKAKKLFIVFDELFRGTNVKDAYDGTLEIVEGFSSGTGSFFIISTHIVEAGEVIREKCRAVSFQYIPSLISNGKPLYTYMPQPGITSDRHGMVIINNEKILDMLHNKVSRIPLPIVNNKSSGNNPVPFTIDKQTQDDLSLLGKFRSTSMFTLFNKVGTWGGERLLEKMFREPLTHAQQINERVQCIRFFQSKKAALSFDEAVFENAEQFLSRSESGGLPGAGFSMLEMKISSALLNDNRQREFVTGLKDTVSLLRTIKDYLDRLGEVKEGPFATQFIQLRQLVYDNRIVGLINNFSDSASTLQLIRYGFLLNTTLHKEMEAFLEILYYIDVYSAVARVAAENNFCYPVATIENSNDVELKGFWYPGLKHAIHNTLSMGAQKNVLFLTGANMAGKSTLMKSFGIAMYLAHMGFPIAAEEMLFTPKDGLYSSINVADNLQMGYSHFYAEVQRVKKAAEQVSVGKNMIILFDELFKGTNVKDAYDATLAVTQAFSQYTNSLFIISTHITEVGDELAKTSDQVNFAYMPTIMLGHVPRYPYQLTEGISTDRHGMVIIRKEGIPQLLA